MYLEMVRTSDDDPGAPGLLAEMADYVTQLLRTDEAAVFFLGRSFAGVEQVALHSEDAEDLVVWSFFDAFSPDDFRRVEQWLGPRTRALLDEVERDVSFR